MKNNEQVIKRQRFLSSISHEFYDSNGDGIGDLQGIIEKLPYIKWLGVNAIWLNPFYASPFMDGGYDVSDYYKVNEKFGNMSDFEELVKKCHNLGVKIVIDLVIGHTSDQHPWFLESVKDEKTNIAIGLYGRTVILINFPIRAYTAYILVTVVI